MRYPLLAARLYNTPLLIQPEKAAVIENVLRQYSNGTPPPIDAAAFESQKTRSYHVTSNGIAVIPVLGTLVHRGSYLDAISGMTSYQRLSSMLAEAHADADVKAVLLDIDSPGGEAAGLFDLADQIRTIQADMPVWAIANEGAYSAAYAIASAATKLFAPQTSALGSIGVIAMHMDESKRDEKKGLRYTAVHAGAKKADFSSHQPLNDSGRASLQSLVDQNYDVFVSTVAANRGLTVQAVRDTEAGIFSAAEAQNLGLIDGIATINEVLTMLSADISQSQSLNLSASVGNIQEKTVMSDKDKQILADKDTPANTFTQANLDTAKAEGHEAGVTEEKARVSGILNHADAEGRTALAHKAVSTGLSVEQAGELLAVSPQIPVANAAGSSFGAAMENLNPDVSADAGTDGDESDSAIASRIVNLIQPHKAQAAGGH